MPHSKLGQLEGLGRHCEATGGGAGGHGNGTSKHTDTHTGECSHIHYNDHVLRRCALVDHLLPVTVSDTDLRAWGVMRGWGGAKEVGWG